MGMLAEIQPLAVVVFSCFVGFVLFLSFYLGRRSKSASGYFAAGGQIHWAVNGVSFAGDYLSAASFLGICGMIATAGYDGFLYSIGYLAGWVVALFVVAEPMKKLGRYTFTDALDSKYKSRSIQLVAAISTLVVSVFYLIPQMVGAGVLVTPLLGLDHWVGVVLVGAIVITIVATAGMSSTTYVQFLKGGLLIIFSAILVFCTIDRGLSTGEPEYDYKTVPFSSVSGKIIPLDASYAVAEVVDDKFVALNKDGNTSWWLKNVKDDQPVLEECQWVTTAADSVIINGQPKSPDNKLRSVGTIEKIKGQSDVKTGSVGVFEYLSILGDKDTIIKRWKKSLPLKTGAGETIVYYPNYTSGADLMRPGQKFKVEGSLLERIDFASLMLALFCGTAALPHILIRYYTVPSPACARKSTIVAIGSIGLFYILTLYMGLGAMTNNVINLESDNMSAPLLANSFGTLLFAIISAIAFATVLGTVSGLIVAASGAIAHDFMDNFLGVKMTDKQKVFAGKAAAFSVGIIAIILGIAFKGMNVSFLVGWAFAVAASANLPAIIMMLFWKKTTASGIVASILVGMVSSLAIILLSPSMFAKYGLNPADAIIPLESPAIISVPLSFITLVVVSLLTKGTAQDAADLRAANAK
ncbi:MAG: cation acetate symporter [Sedimentisphaerales bacterium]|nr:cation acetate symporter [Sedimentisphaerales bacterium]MBN2842189.1 cation acetate symporter [Sedimentisphaerales bacterium]